MEREFIEDVKGTIDWLMDEGLTPTVKNIMEHLNCNHVSEAYIESVIEEVR